MSTSTSTVFVSRVLNLPVMTSDGDQVGSVRDVVIVNRAGQRSPRVKGLVVELFARRRVYLPMERVHSVNAQQVIIAGIVNTRRFERHDHEMLVVSDLFDKRVGDGPSTIFDVAFAPERSRDWAVTEVALREGGGRGPFGRRGHVTIVDWDEVPDFFTASGHDTDQLVARLSEMKSADVAKELHDMSADKRAQVVAALDDEVLAEAMEELPEDSQVEVIRTLDTERAADVLEEMDPDDAADLIAELPTDLAETLLGRMEPEDAEDVRNLLVWEAETAGGLMSPEPVLLAPDDTVADALALIRNPELSPSMAAIAFVARPPLDTPTGRLLGGVHYQRLLRHPPSTTLGELLDESIEPISADAPIARVARYFATYDLVCAPVVDGHGSMLGAVTVDDVLDHILPPDWRDDELHGVEGMTDGNA